MTDLRPNILGPMNHTITISPPGTQAIGVRQPPTSIIEWCRHECRSDIRVSRFVLKQRLEIGSHR